MNTVFSQLHPQRPPCSRRVWPVPENAVQRLIHLEALRIQLVWRLFGPTVKCGPLHRNGGCESITKQQISNIALGHRLGFKQTWPRSLKPILQFCHIYLETSKTSPAHHSLNVFLESLPLRLQSKSLVPVSSRVEPRFSVHFRYTDLYSLPTTRWIQPQPHRTSVCEHRLEFIQSPELWENLTFQINLRYSYSYLLTSLGSL